MLLRTDVTGTRPVGQTDATTTITSVTSASQEALNRLALVSVGKQFQAQIMSRLNDGSFLVRIADITARMALPNTAKAGEAISLTLLASSPRPTFLLGESAGTAEQSIANALQDATGTVQVGKAAIAAADLAATTLAEQLPTSAATSLSTAGRLVDNLLHAAQLDGAPSKILGSSAILAAPDTNPAALAQGLQKSLEFSGLFYESHLNQWVNGSRSLEELMQEPQAQTGNRHATSLNLNNVKGESSLIDMMRALEAAQSTNSQSTTALNNETARLISLQLSALEQRHITWQGELWPGQRFEWEVTEETPKQESDEQVQSWRSTVRFDMPTLGPITASIHLANGHVQMQIRTGTEAAAATLRANGSKLSSALEAAGSPLDLLTVKRNEPA